MPLSVVRARLAERFTLTDTDHRTGGPARYVRVAETGGRLGFITPLTHNFCESCNRVRVTCTGTLFMCLGQEDAADLRAPLRASPSDEALAPRHRRGHRAQAQGPRLRHRPPPRPAGGGAPHERHRRLRKRRDTTPRRRARRTALPWRFKLTLRGAALRRRAAMTACGQASSRLDVFGHPRDGRDLTPRRPHAEDPGPRTDFQGTISMKALLGFSRAVDAVNRTIGRGVSWLILLAVLVSAGNAIVRKLFDTSSNAWLELQWQLFGAVFLLCAAWTLLTNEHIRIDIVSTALPKPVRDGIDIFGHLVFLLPFTVVMIITSVPFFLSSFRVGEQSMNAGGLPVWPAKALVLAGFVLLFLQALSELIKRIAILAGTLPDPHAAGQRPAAIAVPDAAAWPVPVLPALSVPPVSAMAPLRTIRVTLSLAVFAALAVFLAMPALIVPAEAAGTATLAGFVVHNMAPIMFAALVVFLLLGYPVAFALAANGLVFGLVGIEFGLFRPDFLQALPERVFGTMNNDTLLAIPFFTFMGLVLERSGMAEDLLDTIGQLFGPVRGGLAYAVIFVGALLAATTGVVAASVISMGLISLPIMLRYGYDRRLASGVIAASGTLAQIIPPSLVLIVMADQLQRPVGDMYEGAFIPGLMLAGALCGVGVHRLADQPGLGARPAARGADAARCRRPDPPALAAGGGAHLRRRRHRRDADLLHREGRRRLRGADACRSPC